MTWKEFKEAVDKAIEDAGATDEISIWFIDVSYPDIDDFVKGRTGASVTSDKELVVC